MLYSFSLVIPLRLNFMCRRFGTHCLFHLHRRCKREEIFFLLTPPHPTYSVYEGGREDCSETSAYKTQMPENHPKGRIEHKKIVFSIKFSSSLTIPNITKRKKVTAPKRLGCMYILCCVKHQDGVCSKNVFTVN